MHRTMYTTTSTTTALTLTAATGFTALDSAHYTAMGGTGHVLYTLLAANGTDWEVGYGTLSGSTLTRSDYPFNSSGGAGGPGYYYQITLSAGTHTVILSHEWYSGHIILGRYRNATGVSITNTSTTSMGTLATDVDGPSYMQGVGAAAATVVADPQDEIPYARGYRILFSARCADSGGTAGDAFGCQLYVNGASTEYLAGASSPLRGSETVVTAVSPIIDMKPPCADAASDRIDTGSGVTYELWATKSTAVTVDPVIAIEWHL